jgi:hypothetical protein
MNSADIAAPASANVTTNEHRRYAEDDIHLVVPTDCTQMGTWHAELFAYSALRVKQQGKITRVATGCSNGKTDFAQIRRSVNDAMHVHVAPQYGTMEWPFIRKVLGLQHWLKHAKPAVTESVIVVFDADQMLLRRISPNGVMGGKFSRDRKELEQHGILWSGGTMPTEGVTDFVEPGRIISQGYGQGVQWASGWRRKVVEKIVGSKSPTFRVNPLGEHGRRYFSVGFPAMFHISDAHDLFDAWANFTGPVHELIDKPSGGWTADMTAWEIAIAHLGMTERHLRVNNMMLSNTLIGNEEGFSLIDDWHRDTCAGGAWAPDGNSDRIPMVIHYCQGIPRADTWQEHDYPVNLRFHKKHVANNLLDCMAPMHVMPPPNLRELDSGRVAKSGRTKRVSWMACAMMYAIRDMTLAYKTKFCEPGFNMNETAPWAPPKAPARGWGYPTEGQDHGSREGLKAEFRDLPMNDQVL